MLPLGEVMADLGEKAAPEELNKRAGGTTESCLADPAVSALESSVEAIGSPPAEAKPIADDALLIETEECTSNSRQSPLSDTTVGASAPVLMKGAGLRKWRRIKRDVEKDGSGIADSGMILKRRLLNTEPSKTHEENKMKSKADAEREDSVASVESRNADISSLPVGTGALDLELELLASSGFSIGMYSDNSEDHSSKSSTGTSAPRLRHEVLASGKERGRVKFFGGGKGSTHLVLHKVQQGKGGAAVAANKKTKGDLARFEKENSLSSIESDLRSSVVGIVQWGSVLDCNGKLNGRSLNFDEHSDEADTGEEIHNGLYKENEKVENQSREDMKAQLLEENNQKIENYQSSSDLDPFSKSMLFLKEAQEALEKEIKMIAAIGKEEDDIDEQLEGTKACNSPMLQTQLVDFSEKVQNLESKLEEASTAIEIKEQKLRELEALLIKTHLPNMEATNSHELELDSELEARVMQKMEAEIEYLIFSRTTQNWKILSEDHIALLKEEQRHLADDQKKMMLKIRDAEAMAIMLSEQKVKLEAYCRELDMTEDVLRLQNKVCKFSLSFLFQLLLLSIALGLFLVQLLSPADGVVPT